MAVLETFRIGRRALGVLLAHLLLVVGCGGTDQESSEPPLSRLARLGELIFNDVTLSASGRQSCASCHVADVGHAQDDARAAQTGGSDLLQQGRRVSPSIRYLAFGTPFRIDSGGTPSGGFFWDGRASSLADQAARPFFNPVEMALTGASQLAERLAAAPYAGLFAELHGSDIFSRPDDALRATAQALEQFQREDRRLAPFSSKFDAVLRGNASLSVQESRGRKVFDDPLKGNCGSCHTSTVGGDGTHPLFTNFSYHALGVPRNGELSANADSIHFDLGLCAREGGDLAARTDLCGAFKVPSLRNVALRKALFHNGRFKSLPEALRFYAFRDAEPGRFYPVLVDGSIDRFDDLPMAYRTNVVRGEVPYGGVPGGGVTLTEGDLSDLASFLQTLTDGWKP